MKTTTRGDRSLPADVIGELLKKNGMSLALAESCTGGLVSSRITDIPGSSAYFRGSVVAYSNEIKTKVLGVPASLIDKHGAVSRQVAIAMADGARTLTGADISASVTGIAGPAGGSPGKPVGLAYVAVSKSAHRTAKKILFKGGRERLRSEFADAVLEMLLEDL